MNLTVIMDYGHFSSDAPCTIMRIHNTYTVSHKQHTIVCNTSILCLACSQWSVLGFKKMAIV